MQPMELGSPTHNENQRLLMDWSDQWLRLLATYQNWDDGDDGYDVLGKKERMKERGMWMVQRHYHNGGLTHLMMIFKPPSPSAPFVCDVLSASTPYIELRKELDAFLRGATLINQQIKQSLSNHHKI